VPAQSDPAPIVKETPGLLPPGASAPIVESPDHAAPPPSSAADKTLEPEIELATLPDELPADLPEPDEPLEVIAEPEQEPETPKPKPTQPPEWPVAAAEPRRETKAMTRQEKTVAACLAGLDQHQAQLQTLQARQKLAERNILILAAAVGAAFYLIHKLEATEQVAEAVETAAETLT
jgi:hypothetical protein